MTADEAEAVTVDFYRRRPAYTRSVAAMVGLKFKDEAELRQMARQWMLVAIKPQT